VWHFVSTNSGAPRGSNAHSFEFWTCNFERFATPFDLWVLTFYFFPDPIQYVVPKGTLAECGILFLPIVGHPGAPMHIPLNFERATLNCLSATHPSDVPYRRDGLRSGCDSSQICCGRYCRSNRNILVQNSKFEEESLGGFWLLVSANFFEFWTCDFERFATPFNLWVFTFYFLPDPIQYVVPNGTLAECGILFLPIVGHPGAPGNCILFIIYNSLSPRRHFASLSIYNLALLAPL